MTSERRGCSRAAAASGPSKATSWSAPAPLEAPAKAGPSRCPPTATPPSSAGLHDNSLTGAAWVFTRSGGVWTQQGNKLVGTVAVGAAVQGCSVALSADGNTAIVGGPWDDPVGRLSRAGAVWAFTRSGGLWTQQGNKLVGTGAVGGASQGDSVALSADGNTAIVGGSKENEGSGAAWVFTRSDGVSDTRNR